MGPLGWTAGDVDHKPTIITLVLTRLTVIPPAGGTPLHFSPAEDKEDTKDDDDDLTKTGSCLGRLLSTYETFPALSPPSLSSAIYCNWISQSATPAVL